MYRYVRVVRWSRPTDLEASPPRSDRRVVTHTHRPGSVLCLESRTNLCPASETDKTRRSFHKRRFPRGDHFSKEAIGGWDCLEQLDRTNRPRRGVGVAHQLGVNGRFGRRNRRPKIRGPIDWARAGEDKVIKFDIRIWKRSHLLSLDSSIS